MIAIRDMCEKDIDGVEETEKQCFSVPWSRRELESSFRSDFYRFFVADEDERIVGYASLFFAADEVSIANVSVLPEYRRKGIGRALMERIVTFSREGGFTGIFLEVRVSNAPAIALYEAFGFVPVGRRPDYYQKPTEDAFLYCYDIRKETE